MKKLFLLSIILTLIFSCPIFSQEELNMHASLTEIGKYVIGPAYVDVDIFATYQDLIIDPDVGSPCEVLVVVNENSETSMKVGEYYMELRGIPDINLCILDCSTKEEIKRPEFIGNIFYPIKDYLEITGLKKRIKYFVTTKGVPLKIFDVGLFKLDTQAASVDSELAILDYGLFSYDSRIRNPYYNNPENLQREEIPIYLVNRLTSYNLDSDLDGIPDSIKSYLQKALFPPDNQGKFIMDTSTDLNYYFDGMYSIGNDWMNDAASILMKMGADVKLEETNDFLVGESDVIGYCSWGSNDPKSKNHGQPYFNWIDGSIATTYVSTNARTFSYPPVYGQSMISDMIEEGVTGVYGNVYEPFLDAVARPDILFPRYYSGFNLAESYYMSFEFLSWMEIVIGDPLCAPFANPMPRVYITTNKVIYNPDDNFNVDIDIWNTGEDEEVRLYVALALGSELYFYPNWSTIPEYEIKQLSRKSRLHINILDIELIGDIVPGNFVFYSAITDTSGKIIGKLSEAQFQIN